MLMKDYAGNEGTASLIGSKRCARSKRCRTQEKATGQKRRLVCAKSHGCRARGVLLNSWRPRSRELGSGFFFETLLAVIASVERDNRKIPRQLRSRLNAAPA